MFKFLRNPPPPWAERVALAASIFAILLLLAIAVAGSAFLLATKGLL